MTASTPAVERKYLLGSAAGNLVIGVVAVTIAVLSPAIGTHAGPGTVGVAFYAEK